MYDHRRSVRQSIAVIAASDEPSVERERAITPVLKA